MLRGHRWRSLALTATVCLILTISGVVGALVLLVSSLGFAAAALVTAAVNAFLVPYVALVVTLYFDALQDERPEEPEPALVTV